MTTHEDIPRKIADTRHKMREKLGVSGKTLSASLRKGGRKLPRGVRAQARKLAEAESFADHPRLRLTLDPDALDKAAHRTTDHLDTVDPADQRLGWWLGVLGGLVFNLLVFAVIVIVILRWRGFV